MAVLNPTDVEQLLKLNTTSAKLSDKGTLWRLASVEPDGRNPSISRSLVTAIPSTLTLPRFSVNIFEFTAKK